jgi:hypothetical protein
VLTVGALVGSLVGSLLSVPATVGLGVPLAGVERSRRAVPVEALTA